MSASTQDIAGDPQGAPGPHTQGTKLCHFPGADALMTGVKRTDAKLVPGEAARTSQPSVFEPSPAPAHGDGRVQGEVPLLQKVLNGVTILQALNDLVP